MVVQISQICKRANKSQCADAFRFPCCAAFATGSLAKATGWVESFGGRVNIFDMWELTLWRVDCDRQNDGPPKVVHILISEMC